MPFAPELPDQLEARGLRDTMMEAGQYLHGLRQKPEDARGDGYDADVRSAVGFINDYDDVLKALEAGEARAALQDVVAGSGPLGAHFGEIAEMRSPGEQVVASDGYAEATATGEFRSGFRSFEIDSPLLPVEGRALVDTSNAGVFRPVGQPLAPNVRQRRLFIRDVLNTQGTGLSSIPYIRESMPAGNETGASGAATTAEGAAKSEVTMGWTQADAPVRKITAWVPATSEILDDAPTLMGYINNRLTYLLALREELQIIAGDGSAPNLRGILSTSGLQEQAFTATDPMVTIGLAIAAVENVDGEPDGIVVHPTSFWTWVTTRQAEQFEGNSAAGYGAPFGAPPSTLWGLTAIRSRSVTVDEPIIGSWRLGASLFDRQRSTIMVGNQHSDYFTTNKVAVVAEERVALAVHRPDFFCRAICHEA